MTKPTFSHVIFQRIRTGAEVSVPIAEAEAWHNANGREPHRVTKVHDGDPTKFSWAKAWYFIETGSLARIGAGAYGDYTVWRHPAADGLMCRVSP